MTSFHCCLRLKCCQYFCLVSQQVKQTNIVKELFCSPLACWFLKAAPADNNVCNLIVQKQFETYFLWANTYLLFPSSCYGVSGMQVISFSLSYRKVIPAISFLTTHSKHEFLFKRQYAVYPIQLQLDNTTIPMWYIGGCFPPQGIKLFQIEVTYR